jgi:formyl-CoA transferase
VDTSLLAGALSLQPDYVAIALGTGNEVPKAGPGHSLGPPPYGVWTAKDGKELAISGGAQWPDFCERMGVPELIEDPRFSSPEARRDCREELRALLEKAMLERTRDEWVATLQEGGHWACPVKSVLEIANDGHLAENDMIAEIQDPLRGLVRQLNNPIQLSETATSVRRPVPSYAEHSSEIAQWLGYTGPEVDDLIEQGVIKQRAD